MIHEFPRMLYCISTEQNPHAFEWHGLWLDNYVVYNIAEQEDALARVWFEAEQFVRDHLSEIRKYRHGSD